MSRLRTFYNGFDNSGFPGATGPGTFFLFTCDLSTNAGIRQFDVAIAAMFRITRWEVTGRFTDGVDTDVLDAVQDATISGAYPDERAFAAAGSFDGAYSNNNLIIGSSGTWGGFELPASGLQPWIQHTDSGNIGVIPFHFQAIAPTIAQVFQSSSGVEEVGTITIRVPGWRGASFHELRTPLYNASGVGGSANVLIRGVESLAYANEAGEPVWDTATGENLIDPVTASIP